MLQNYGQRFKSWEQVQCIYPVNMNPCACSHQLYPPIWGIGTTAELAARGSYRKQHTASCAGRGLRALTLEEDALGRAKWC